MVATSPLADSRSPTNALALSLTLAFDTTTIMPLPIAAGVLGMQRTIAADAPSSSSNTAMPMPAAMLRKVVPPPANLA